MSLDTPQILTATVVSTTEVALSWSGINGATSYFIWSGGAVIAGTTNTFLNITDLTPGVHTFQVQAIGFDGGDLVESELSDPVTVDTTGGADPPPDPGSLDTPTITKAQQVGLDGAEIGWTAITGATRYEVRIDGGAPADVGNVLGFTETGLSPGDRTYEVRAVNTDPDPDVFSDWSAPVTLTIAELTAPVVTATVLSDSIIDLTWPVVPGAQRYEVSINEADPLNAGSTPEFRATGLLHDTEHSFRVRALSGEDPETEGPWSEPVTARTFPFVAPPTVAAALKRLTHYLSNRGITARAVNTELNNIYLLLGSELGFTQPVEPVEPSEPEEPPEPEPGDPGDPPPEPTPPPPEPTPSGGDKVVTVVDTANTSHQVGLPDYVAGERVYLIFNTGFESSPIAPPAGWEAAEQSRQSTLSRSEGVFFRDMDGGEGTTVTYTTAGTHKSVNVTIRFGALTGSGAGGGTLVEAFSGNTAPIPSLSIAGPASTVHWRAAAHFRGGGRTLGSITVPAGWATPVIGSTSGLDLAIDRTLIATWRTGGLTQGGFDLVAVGPVASGGRSRISATAPSAADLFLRNTQNGPGTGTIVETFSTYEVYDKSPDLGSPEAGVTGTHPTTSAGSGGSLRVLGWTTTLGTAGSALESIQWSLRLGTVSSTAAFQIGFWRVRASGGREVITGSGNTFGPQSGSGGSSNTTITRTVTVTSKVWEPGDRLLMVIDLQKLPGSGAASVEVRTQHVDSFVRINP